MPGEDERPDELEELVEVEVEIVVVEDEPGMVAALT
jgi:hypothetical protein